jgi:nicotinate-nucleotide pyrophosphorylase (carboxylating)
MLKIYDAIAPEILEKHVRTSLSEDIGEGDMTTSLTVDPAVRGAGRFISRQQGIVCGLELLKIVYKCLSEKKAADFNFLWEKSDGDIVNKEEEILQVEGPLDILLTGERVALNYLQQLSGVASATRRLVDIADFYNVRVYDTRKTVPHLRKLQKYAVRCGGGYNHRMRLDKGVMIKDNHKQAAGGLKAALEKIDFSEDKEIVVEIHSPEEIETALNFDIDVLMLDNMTPERIEKIINHMPEEIEVEISGGINELNLEDYCKTGVDRVSAGSITHSFDSLDISFGLINNG